MFQSVSNSFDAPTVGVYETICRQLGVHEEDKQKVMTRLVKYLMNEVQTNFYEVSPPDPSFVPIGTNDVTDKTGYYEHPTVSLPRRVSNVMYGEGDSIARYTSISIDIIDVDGTNLILQEKRFNSEERRWLKRIYDVFIVDADVETIVSTLRTTNQVETLSIKMISTCPSEVKIWSDLDRTIDEMLEKKKDVATEEE